jgi:hypothetical protein
MVIDGAMDVSATFVVHIDDSMATVIVRMPTRSTHGLRSTTMVALVSTAP